MEEITKLRLKIVLIPIIILLLILIAPLPFYFIGRFAYRNTMPLVLVISSFFVFLIGAWWDFGAKDYLKDLMEQHLQISEEEVVYINKQQLILTLLFILVGLLYILVGYIISIA